MHTAVLGAGISGLTTAFRLAQAGHRVTLIEASGQLGGLGTFFEHDGRTFEKFYHCMLPSDGPLLALLDDLGLTSDIYWKPTTFAYADQRRIFSLNGALDLLRFSPLSFIDRLRVGLTGLYGRLCSDKGLDDITTAQWLEKWSGRTAFKKFWQPMLEAKFGDRYPTVPALWFWTRFNREKGESKGECKGYIRGGYKRITDTFAIKLKELGVDLRLNTPIDQIDLTPDQRPTLTTATGTETFDQMIVTLPWPTFSKIASPALKAAAPNIDWSIDFQAVINHFLFLKRPLQKNYWLATPEPEYPFDGIVETSTLTDESDRGPGRNVVYLTKYLHRTDPRFTQPEAEITSSWFAALQKLFPDLKESDIEAQHLFRAPFVEPIYTTGYLNRRPPEVLIPGRLHLATSAQVYPVVTSWNGSVTQANRTLATLLTKVPTDTQKTTALLATTLTTSN
jgi:protoporphyrinogen oxidase